MRIASINIADDPDGWREAGFSVEPDGTCRVGDVLMRLVGRSDAKRITAWGLAADDDETGGALNLEDIDGLATSLETCDARDPGSHANGAVAIDHLVVLTPDQDRTTSAMARIGLELRRTRETDQYGPPFEQRFYRAGTAIVEVIGPVEASGDGPATFYGLAFNVEDLDATAALLDGHIGDIHGAVQPGRRIATLRHKQLGISVPTAFMSAAPPR